MCSKPNLIIILKQLNKQINSNCQITVINRDRVEIWPFDIHKKNIKRSTIYFFIFYLIDLGNKLFGNKYR